MNDINCFVCVHCDWDYMEDVPFPIHDHVICRLSHEKTSYNTPYNEHFTCEDYKHSYFVKSYWGMWFWTIYISFVIIVMMMNIWNVKI